ncbi:PREDICTED: homeobox protein notochord [Chinchilla lanigera]|uniref:homeobox protein notochord n=1 Tax=Chinchilla lanigera TaxID=34839 RepID=UPI00038E9B18|nr:PREDICTED: homeobox protein notochord [Chinchilla lanigera]
MIISEREEEGEHPSNRSRPEFATRSLRERWVLLGGPATPEALSCRCAPVCALRFRPAPRRARELARAWDGSERALGAARTQRECDATQAFAICGCVVQGCLCSHDGKRSKISSHLNYHLKITVTVLPGWELAHCSGLWVPPDWAPPEDLQDTERHQKRVRTMFNLEQLEELEKVFAKQHNLVGKKRAQLASRLHLTENQVRIWFQNRRVKYQKQQKLKLPALSAAAASPDEPSSSSDSSTQSEDAESGADS